MYITGKSFNYPWKAYQIVLFPENILSRKKKLTMETVQVGSVVFAELNKILMLLTDYPDSVSHFEAYITRSSSQDK